MGNKQSNANEPQDGVPVNLHVYKPTDPNNVGLPGFRIYHTGIEIYGCEYTFAGNQTQSTGVMTQRPKANPMGGQWSFLQTEVLGHTQMSKQEIKELIFEMKRDFIANTYDLTSRNCNHFTEAVAKNIGMRSYPGWVNRAAKVGNSVRSVMGNPDLSSFAPESEEEKRQKQSLQLVFNQNLDLFQASKQGSKNKGGTALVDMDKVGALNLSDATKNKQSLLSVFEAGSSLFDHTAQRKTSSNSNAYNARQLHSSAQSAKSLHQRVLVESDADEQMLFFIPFNQPTKIKSMIFRLANHADECVFNPSTVKLFKNKRNMDFNDAVSDKPTQMLTVELPTTDTCGEDGDHVDSVVDVSFPLKFVSFQDVSFLTIFIEDNQGDMDVTKLRGIQLIGEIKEV